MSAEDNQEPGNGDLEAVRGVVLRAYPDAVAELIGGASVAEVLASVEPARAAFARIAEELGANAGTAAPPAVPAGATAAAVVDPATLPAHELIRRGVRARRG